MIAAAVRPAAPGRGWHVVWPSGPEPVCLISAGVGTILTSGSSFVFRSPSLTSPPSAGPADRSLCSEDPGVFTDIAANPQSASFELMGAGSLFGGRVSRNARRRAG